MSPLEHVHVAPMDPHRFQSVVSPTDYDDLLALVERAAHSLHGRVIWNVNSTARGGGVVELLRPLLGYSRGGGVDARWLVVGGDPSFFELTKRLHNRLHGVDGDGGPLGVTERARYEANLAANAQELTRLVRRRDIVILHDPQTAGLVPAVRATGAICIWRCHVGIDHENAHVREACAFLAPYVTGADAYVFSRSSYMWAGLTLAKTSVIHPSIDVFSPKNAGQSPEQTLAILATAGVIAARAAGQPTYMRSDGTPGRVDRRAEMVEDAPLPTAHPLVAQVSRWDSLKDPLGVMSAFADHIADRSAAHLVLAGPATASVADDPEGRQVFADVCAAWRSLPAAIRGRVHLAALPMDDVEENAAIVNALQRHADVVVQKSLAEGFGLTVSEAMWKRRPVVGSRVGGIQDQIVDGESGVLISDPHDLAGFGAAVNGLLANPARAERIGRAARERVREHFLAPHHLTHYFELIHRLMAPTIRQAASNVATTDARAQPARMS
jgi:trehalose synthase